MVFYSTSDSDAAIATIEEYPRFTVTRKSNGYLEIDNPNDKTVILVSVSEFKRINLKNYWVFVRPKSTFYIKKKVKQDREFIYEILSMYKYSTEKAELKKIFEENELVIIRETCGEYILHDWIL